MRSLCAALVTVPLVSSAGAKPAHQKQAARKAATRNILFVILDDWSYYNQLNGLSSVYDLDIDGDTDDDRAIIEANLGKDCRPQ